MIVLRQHIPAYVDLSEPPQVATAETQADLLATPWVQRYACDQLVARGGVVRRRPFYRFSLSENHLMAEHHDGRHWWVVGTITSGRDQLDLPPWVMHPDGRRRVDAWNRGDTEADDGFDTLPLA